MSFSVGHLPEKSVFFPASGVIIIQTVLRGRMRTAVVRTFFFCFDLNRLWNRAVKLTSGFISSPLLERRVSRGYWM